MNAIEFKHKTGRPSTTQYIPLDTYYSSVDTTTTTTNTTTTSSTPRTITTTTYTTTSPSITSSIQDSSSKIKSIVGKNEGTKRCLRCCSYYNQLNPASMICYYHPGFFQDRKYDNRFWSCCYNQEKSARGCVALESHVEDYQTTSVLDSFPIDPSLPHYPSSPIKQEKPTTEPSITEESEQYLRKADGSVFYKHKILPYDTLSHIAIKYGVKPQVLKQVNNIWGPDQEIHLKTFLLIPTENSPSIVELESKQRASKIKELEKKFHISTEEASFYLDDGGGNMDVAIANIQQALQWERDCKK